MKSLCLLIAGFCFLTQFSANAAKTPEPPPVELLTDTPRLQPSSTLDFRFAKPMISRDEIGLVAKIPPIVFAPAVRGNFTWLSRSSAVFTPDEAWPLGTEFVLTLRNGVKSEDGIALAGSFRASFRTPPFMRTMMRGESDDPDEPLRPSPKIIFAYNLALDLASAEGLFQFVNSSGKKVPAKVRYGTRADYLSLQPEQGDWEDRWQRAKHGAPPPTEGSEDEDEATDQAEYPPILSRLVITPSSILTPGGKWRLEMKRGLKAKSGRHQITEQTSMPLGVVRSFIISKLEPQNYINSGRSVLLEFSYGLAPDITPETAAKYFRFDPPVPNLVFEGFSTSLTARGNFEQGRPYRLEVDAAVISEDGLPFDDNRRRTFHFSPVAPRLYLPTITAHQLRGGLRKFEALSANLKTVKVTAQLVAPADAAASVAAFKDYEAKDNSNGEQYQRLPAGSISGKTIYERTIELPRGAIDTHQQTVLDWDEILGAKKAGVIFLTVEGEPIREVGGKRPGAQALIQLTDLGALWKKVAEGLRVSVFSMATDRPLAGVSLALLNKQFVETGHATTDAEGNVALALAPELAWLVMTQGEDVHALRIGADGSDLPMAAFRVPVSYSAWVSEKENSLDLRTFIFTDRPLYRPNETVHVKGIVREVTAAGLTRRAGLEGVLKLRDSRGSEVSDTDIRTDERGAFDAELTLNGSSTGNYSLSLDFKDSRFSSWQNGSHCRFVVADFQPNAFELDLPMPARLAPDAAVSTKVAAKYFFGAPVTKADVRWTLRYARTLFAPEGFEGWRFGEDEGPESKILTLRGGGAFAGADGLAIQPQLPAAKDAPYKGVLTVEATDVNQQTVSESRLFMRDAADFYLGVEAADEGVVFRPGDRIAGRVVAIRPDGTPMPQPVEVNAELIRERFETVRVQGADKAISFRSEKIEEVVAKESGRTLLPVHANDGWQVPEGSSVSFKTDRAGEYRLRVTAKDSGGRLVTSVLTVFVTGRGEIAWDYRNPAQLDLVADKQEYKPGDTARLLVKAPISGEALVTIERGERILRTMRVKLEGNAPAIEVPLEKNDAPNVFVSMVLLRGSEQSTRKIKTPEYRYGLAMLRVSDPAERLQIEITPARAVVQPGEEVDAEVQLRNGVGAPVADAEVTFFAVDDGILALTGYERPALQPIFHAPFSLAVRTGLTLFDLLPEQDPAEVAEFSNKGYLIGGGGLEGPGLKLRRDFPGTACWFPSLRTDATGKVRVRFPAPDALTRYRLVAIAHAGTNLFGSGESAFTIRKPLMILSALGQFANVGDELIARAVVRNETGADATAQVSLQLDGTAEAAKPGAEALRANIEVKNDDAQTVDFPVRLRAMGSAEWKWDARIEARGQTFEDRVAASLTVGSPAPVLRETYLPELSAASSDLLAGVNPQLLDGAGTVAVTVSNTRLATLRESVNRLLEYPYGCAEQTVSSLIPWALLPELRPIIPDLVKDDAQVAAVISKGLDRLFSMQFGGGGIGYWPNANYPSLFASAYGALACAILEKHDIALPPGHDLLLDYLSKELRGTGLKRNDQLLADRVLAVYALAASGKAEPAYHEELFRRRAELSRESRAVLALAIQEAKGPAAMVDELLDPKATAPDESSWFGGPARERAIQLLAWSQSKPKSTEVARLTKELLGYRRNGHWGTTQQNAWALLALARYYKAAEDGGKPVKGTLVSADHEQPFEVTFEKPAITQALAFAPAKPLGAISIRNPAKGTLFGEARFVVRPPVAAQPRQDRGYAVSRVYRKLADDGSLQEPADLKVGDRVLVTLHVETTRPGHFVAIDDPLPAILEAVNPAFQSRVVAGGEVAGRDWVSDYREMRADRVIYFCDHLPAGTFTFRYLARVRSAGTTMAGPTKVEEMYRPERFGLSEATQLVSRVAEGK